MTLHAVLFDLGNVLVRFSHERMHTQMGAVLGVAPSDVHEVLAADRRQWRYECGELTTDELFGELARRATRPFTRADLELAVCDIFDPIAPMRAVTRALKAHGLRLVLVSNTNELHLEHIRRRYDVLEPCDALVLSYVVKAMKPDPAFYAAALAAAGCAPARALFVDDLPENVKGARAAGFAAERFTTPEAFTAALLRYGSSVPTLG